MLETTQNSSVATAAQPAVAVEAEQSSATLNERPRHAAFVRATHWLTTIAFLAMLVTGIEILISHPRFYWGETGNVNTQPLFTIHIPSSRATVPTGYGYVLPDQNGWSRSLHFEAAWLAVATGVIYLLFGLLTGHFRRNLFPDRGTAAPKAFTKYLAEHLRFRRPSDAEASTYNVVQRLTYLAVIFVLFPLMIWTGLAMSLAVEGAFPSAVAVLGGRQSARTIHFFVTGLLVLFVFVHIVMIARAGFVSRVRAMVTGRPAQAKERS